MIKYTCCSLVGEGEAVAEGEQAAAVEGELQEPQAEGEGGEEAPEAEMADPGETAMPAEGEEEGSIDPASQALLDAAAAATSGIEAADMQEPQVGDQVQHFCREFKSWRSS